MAAKSNWVAFPHDAKGYIHAGAALKMGIAGKVRASLDATLNLEPRHAEAHTALALYHAEIINRSAP